MPDHTALVKILTYFLLVTSGLALAARLSIKRTTSKTFNLDDVLVLASLLFNIGAGVALSISADHGLVRSTTADQVPTVDGSEAGEKALYAFVILYILTVTLANLSISALLRLLLSNNKSHKLANSALAVLILVQGVGLVFAASFTCALPDAWAIASGRCIDMRAFWRAVSILNILTDIALMALPCFMVAQIKIPFTKKITVASCFGFRIVAVAASATQLAYTNRFHTPYPISRLWPWYLIGQVVQTTIIISSCVPYLRAALQAFPSGMFQPDEIRRRGLRSTDRVQGFVENSSHSYFLKDVEEVGEREPTRRSQSILPGRNAWPERRTTTTAEVSSSPTMPTRTRDQGLSIQMSRSVSVTTWPKTEDEKLSGES